MQDKRWKVTLDEVIEQAKNQAQQKRKGEIKEKHKAYVEKSAEGAGMLRVF